VGPGGGKKLGPRAKNALYFNLANISKFKVFKPTDAQFDSLKNNFNFALKLTLKSSYMFRRENTIINCLILAKVTIVKMS
jgi:hypothetical protein